MCGLVALMKRDITVSDMTFMHDSLQRLTHRGPDDQRLFYNDHLALGFNRLSILDVEGGAQPFQMGAYQLLFNGEIYNYLQLRSQLERLGFSFETNSEAEVILSLYQLLGPEFMSQLRGMFSLVLYDQDKKRLLAVRDKFGIKPLYYVLGEESLYLTSELKTLKQQNYQDSSVCYEALQHYFTFQYIPEPKTALKGVHVLEPGTYLTFDLASGLEIKKYATVELIPTRDHSNVLKEQLRDAVLGSVEAHLQSDAEVGCFLSGGLDSTIITTCARGFKKDLKAFTIGFDVMGYSEVADALKTAEALEIQLVTRQINAHTFMKYTREVIEVLDMPVADPSCVAIYLIAQEARKHVKVVLSGEGADELFGGYRKYREVNALKAFEYVPQKLKKALLMVNRIVPNGVRGKDFITRGCTPLRERYVGNAFVFNEKEKERLLTFYNEQYPFSLVTDPIYDASQHLDLVSQMQTIDIQTWLKGDILTKSDRLSMAHGLELRVPFLDEKVLELARQLTKREKIAGSQTKILLREAFRDYVPPHVYEGSKKGYPVPLASWLRSELYEEAKAIITSPSCKHLINQDVALSYLERHRKGRENNARKIWTLMTFVLWYESWIGILV